MITEHTPKLVPATLADYPTIQNMGRFYVYDMSRECGPHYPGWECPADGLFECRDLKRFFEPPAHAYFVKVGDEIAGFALINKHEILDVDFYMSQFFILAKFQRQGISHAMAQASFRAHPGRWSVGVIPQNKRALHFWRKVIGDFTSGNYIEREYSRDELKTLANPEPYPMIILTFDVAASR
jgi:predicted acetyltransferase